MITIQRKEECVGCAACVERCPVQCISFEADEQGFRYPKVDVARCINCSLCEKVCPVINRGEEIVPLAVYGAVNSDSQVVESSSSGGIFFELAKNIIEQGGVVFGARFDEEYNVFHSYAETIEELYAFQGSKYVQSYIGESYKQAEVFLKQGRKVLFTGTPCQIAGLGLFLRKDFGHLLLKVDVICHGVPSPLVWSNYLKELVGDKQSLKRLSFRDKRQGWNNYGFAYTVSVQGKQTEHFELMRKNVYMQAFLRDLTLRPSCFECPSKAGRSDSDITLGDFWRVETLEPQIASPSGTSLVVIHSLSGNDAISSLDLRIELTTYDKLMISNSSIRESSIRPNVYTVFWKSYLKNNSNKILVKYVNKSRKPVIFRFLRRIKAALHL